MRGLLRTLEARLFAALGVPLLAANIAISADAKAIGPTAPLAGSPDGSCTSNGDLHAPHTPMAHVDPVGDPEPSAPISTRARPWSVISGLDCAVTHFAAEQPGAGPGEAVVLIPLVAPLIVNGRNLGDIDVWVDTIGRGEIDAVRLTQLLRPVLEPGAFAELNAAIAGAPRVRFERFAGGPLPLAFDPASLEVRAAADASALSVSRLSIAGVAPPDLTTVRKQAVLASAATFALDQTYVHRGATEGRAPLVGEITGYTTIGGFTGVVAQYGARWTEDAKEPWQRLPVRLTHDLFASAIRATAGELTPGVTSFQGTAQLAGLSLARNYAAIRPFQNVQPAGRSALTLERDSTVIVEVNGIEQRRLRLGPGRYELSEFGPSNGSNTVRLSIEDAAGRREAAVLSVFNANQLLEPGVTDFAVSAGLIEGDERGEYSDDTAATAYVRAGVSPRLTAALGGQVVGNDWQATAEATTALGGFVVRTTGAASAFGAKDGAAGALDVRRDIDISQKTSAALALSLQGRSKYFSSPLSRRLARNDQTWRGDVRLDVRRSSTSFSLSYSQTEVRSAADDTRALDFTYTSQFGGVSASIDAGVYQKARKDYVGFVGLSLNYRLGARENLRARQSGRADRTRAIEWSRSREDRLDDLSGRVELSQTRDANQVAASALYLNNRFEAAVDHNTTYADTSSGPTRQESRARFVTSAAFADGGFAFGRPALNGFALVERHPTLKGSRVTLADDAGRNVARTGAFGAALAPLDRAYALKTYSISVDPLPDGYDIGDASLRTFPGAGAGYRAVVGSDASRTALGELVGPTGPIAEVAFSVIDLGRPKSEPRVAFTNSVGRFYLDRLAPGAYAIQIEGVQVATFEVPAKSSGVVQLGRLVANAK